MSKAAVSIFVFGIYLVLLGLGMLLIPNFILSIFTFPETSEVWIQCLGMVLLLLGYIYIRAGRKGDALIDFYRWTTHTRPTVIVFLIVFVLLGLAKWMLILFGVIDLVAAIWTALALRSEAKATTA